MAQGPCNGNLAGGTSVASADRLHAVGEREIPGELRLLKGGGAAAEVVLREVLDALLRHLASEKAGLHRRVDDYADSVLLTVGQDLRLHFGRNGRIGRLE